VAESYVPFSTEPCPGAVRAAMRQQIRQTGYLRRLNRFAVKINDARNSAHN
jgi:hypothetical protein